MTTADDAGDRVLAILAHVLGFITKFVLGPFGFAGPLIILVAAEREPVKQHARRALNWQVSYLLYTVLLLIVFVVSIPLMIVGIGFVTLALSMIALIALSIADLVFVIIAAVRASEDRLYEYPLTIRFVKDPKTRLHPVGRDEGTKTSQASKAKRSPKKTSDRTVSKKPSKTSGSKKTGSK